VALESIDAEDFVIEYVGELIRRPVIFFLNQGSLNQYTSFFFELLTYLHHTGLGHT
jgi:SET domain-containing protein